MEERKVTILNPCKIPITPMERLLLINFDGDPDSKYTGFEPQVFDDSLHGKGHLIIGWRVDGKVDIYHQESLTLDPKKYDIVGKGLEKMIRTDFEKAHYEVGSFGVCVSYQFKDIYGRDLVIKVHEKNPKRRKPFSLLAPMGDAAEKPSAMPLILLNDFYFVRKKHTEIKVAIDGKSHRPDELPLPIDGSKMFYTRYSSDPLIANFNPEESGEIIPLNLELNQKRMHHAGWDYEIEWDNEKPSIKQMVFKNEKHSLGLFFKKAFPDIRTLENDGTVYGEFDIQSDPRIGVIKGEYVIKKEDNIVKITMVPSGGWKPNPAKLSLRFLYRVAKIFKHWPKTYEWTALIEEKSAGKYHMDSKWKRINR